MIEIRNLGLELPGFALQGIDLRIEHGEYFVLVGPYASGKTLLLETIAGLRKATSGAVLVGERDVTTLDSERRNIGIVYQDCALFPHLTVAENIAFGLRVRHQSPPDIQRELDRIAHLFGIGSLFARKPEHLSGGEKQKVALARALVTDPDVLLLDEPLGALDPQTRAKIREEIRRIHRQLGISVIHVTHDLEEAVTMGTRIAVMGGGSIRQVGSPDEVFRHPNSEFVARFTMAVNVFAGVAHRLGNGITVFATHGISLTSDAQITGACLAAVRPENVLVSKVRPVDEGVNVFDAEITDIVNKGSVVDVSVDLPPAFTCLLTRHASEHMGLEVGQRVYLRIPPSLVSLFSG